MSIDRSRRRLLSAIGLGALAGCGLVPPANLQSPRLTFSGFDLKSIGLEEVRFRLIVEADNPNAVDIPLSNLAFELELLGQPFAKGRSELDRIELPRRGSRAVPIEFTVRTVDLLDLLRASRWSDPAALAYRLRGEANWSRSPFKVRFERKGSFEALRRLQQLLDATER
ncbi:MAG: LEA type 2 family protein [Burkholderiales bacterium]|nr:MAG: LEA type 2 family protein [Burkholderiales bacterium]